MNIKISMEGMKKQVDILKEELGVANDELHKYKLVLAKLQNNITEDGVDMD